jgi:hypothetical protein
MVRCPDLKQQMFGSAHDGDVLMTDSEFAKCELLVGKRSGIVIYVEFGASYMFENQRLA